MERKLLLEVKNLVTEFKTDDGYVKAVNDVSFNLYRGETVGRVVVSGSGKTVTSISSISVLADPPSRIASGQIIY
ncbi:MAG: peptide ABC transporter ATP-binding protein, partial [Bacteroidetes bacterium]|nr:peptide ABC transporter ATP-binding protein [Bacteroidota bacterium]